MEVDEFIKKLTSSDTLKKSICVFLKMSKQLFVLILHETKPRNLEWVKRYYNITWRPCLITDKIFIIKITKGQNWVINYSKER